MLGVRVWRKRAPKARGSEKGISLGLMSYDSQGLRWSRWYLADKNMGRVLDFATHAMLDRICDIISQEADTDTLFTG